MTMSVQVVSTAIDNHHVSLIKEVYYYLAAG